MSYKIVRERERAHLCNITLQKCNNRKKPKPNFPARKLANFLKLFVKTAKVLKEMHSDLFLYIKECHCRNLSRKSELYQSWTLIIVLYTCMTLTYPLPAFFRSFSRAKRRLLTVCSVYTVLYRVLHYKAEFYGVELL